MMRNIIPRPSLSAISIAIQTIKVQGEYGKITALSQEIGRPRAMLYRYREKALMAINSAFDEAKGCDTIQITTEQKIAQTIVVLRVVCHASIRNIQDLLPQREKRANSLSFHL